MDLKKIIEIDDTKGPLFFLVISALLLGTNLGFLLENLERCGSVIFTEPIFKADNIFLTFSNILHLCIVAIIFIAAFAQKYWLLKISYFLVSLSLLLKTNFINKIGYKSLYAVKIIALFIVVMILSKYLSDKIDYYKSVALSKQKELSEP
jgi:hypothetical protein